MKLISFKENNISQIPALKMLQKLGYKYLLPNEVLILVILGFSLGIIRNVTDEYKEAYGLFSDVWAPFVESAISIVVAMVCGSYWGLQGVLLGGITSTLIIVYGWQPFYLFTRGLKYPVMGYVYNFLKDVGVLFLCYYISSLTLNLVYPEFTNFESWVDWIVNAVLVVTMFVVISFVIMNIFIPGMRTFSKRVLHKL